MRPLLAAAAVAAYGLSIGQPLRLLAAAAVAWGLSLALLVPLSQRPTREVIDHGARTMLAGALPLIPLAIANGVAASAPANAVMLSLDGALMLAVMAARLRQTWNACVWAIVLAAAGLATWVLL